MLMVLISYFMLWGIHCLLSFPIFLGYTAAKAFKMDGFVGMAIGACLLYSQLFWEV